MIKKSLCVLLAFALMIMSVCCFSSCTDNHKSWFAELYDTEMNLPDITLKEWLASGDALTNGSRLHFLNVDSIQQPKLSRYPEKKYPPSEIHEENPVVRNWIFDEIYVFTTPVGAPEWSRSSVYFTAVTGMRSDDGTKVLTVPFDQVHLPSPGDTVLVFGLLNYGEAPYPHAHGLSNPPLIIPMLLQADGSVACLLGFMYDPIDELVNQEEGSE